MSKYVKKTLMQACRETLPEYVRWNPTCVGVSKFTFFTMRAGHRQGPAFTGKSAVVNQMAKAKGFEVKEICSRENLTG